MHAGLAARHPEVQALKAMLRDRAARAAARQCVIEGPRALAGALAASGCSMLDTGSMAAAVHGMAADRANPGGPVRALDVAHALDLDVLQTGKHRPQAIRTLGMENAGVMVDAGFVGDEQRRHGACSRPAGIPAAILAGQWGANKRGRMART